MKLRRFGPDDQPPGNVDIRTTVMIKRIECPRLDHGKGADTALCTRRRFPYSGAHAERVEPAEFVLGAGINLQCDSAPHRTRIRIRPVARRAVEAAFHKEAAPIV